MALYRVVVCGGRNFSNRALLFKKMDELHQQHQFRDFMQGGASGADALARIWAKTHPEIVRWECKADWKEYGRKAGPIRNKRMLQWCPDLVVAFPGGDGTADMVKQARAAGIEVIEVKP